MAEKELRVKFDGDSKGIQQAAGDAQGAVKDFSQEATKDLQAVADKLEAVGKQGAASAKNLQGLNVAGVDIGNLKGAMAGAAGAGAILTQGLKALGTIAKTALQMIAAQSQKAVDAVKHLVSEYKELHAASQEQRKANLDAMKTLADLQQQENLSNAQKAKMIEVVNRLAKAQGGLNLKIDEGTGKIKNFDAAYAKMLEQNKQKQISEIEVEIKNLIAQQKRLKQIVGGSVLVHGVEGINKAGEEMMAAGNEQRKLQRRLDELRKQDPAGDYLREAEAKRKDMLAAQAKEWDAVYKGLVENIEDLGADDLNKALAQVQRKYDETINRLGGLKKIPAELKAKLDEWAQAERQRIAQNAESVLNERRASLDIDTLATQGNDAQAARMRLAAQYEKLRKDFGGDAIAKEDEERLNRWYAAEMDKLRKSEQQKTKETAIKKAQIEEKEMRKTFEARKTALEKALNREVAMHERALQRIQRERAKYKFNLPDYDPLNDTLGARRDRRRATTLDASITDKLARQERGERVNFTKAEKERIRAAQELEQREREERKVIANLQKDAAAKLAKAADKLEKAVARLMANAERGGEPTRGRQNRAQNARNTRRGTVAGVASKTRVEAVSGGDPMRGVIARLDAINVNVAQMARNTFRVV